MVKTGEGEKEEERGRGSDKKEGEIPDKKRRGQRGSEIYSRSETEIINGEMRIILY